MGFKAATVTPSINGAPAVPRYLELAAYSTLSTAMAWALREGIAIHPTQCDRCSDRTGSPSKVCSLCALAIKHTPNSKLECEEIAAALLSLPDEWLVDFHRGFSGERKAQDYPSAVRFGRKLRRRYAPAVKEKS